MSSSAGRVFRYLGYLILAAIVVFIGWSYWQGEPILVRRIGPGEVGVRTTNIPPFGGIHEEEVGIGWHLHIPGVTEITPYNVRVQTYEMVKDPEKGDQEGRDDIDFKTNDGQKAWIEMSLEFKVVEENANRLLRYIGEHDDYIKKLRSLSRSIARTELGKNTAEEIYQGERRMEVETKIHAALVRGLAREVEGGLGEEHPLDWYGLEIMSVYLRNFEFTEEYQAAVEQKKIEMEKKNAAQVAAERKRVEAEGEANARIEQAQGARQAAEIEAEGEKRAAELRAEGNLALATAEAEGKRQLTEAMGGGENVVKLEFAKQLSDKIQIWGVPTGGGGGDMGMIGLYGIVDQLPGGAKTGK